MQANAQKSTAAGITLAALTLATALLLSAARPATAQSDVDPTDQNATVQAAIGGLLTETADAAGIVPTQTARAEQAAATTTAESLATSAAQTQAASTPDLTQTIDAGLQGTVAAITQEANASEAQLTLRAGAAPLLAVTGDTFRMGTTVTEAAEAVRECTDVYNAGCLLSYAEDSIPAHEITLDGYQIAQTETSYAQYVTFLNALGPGSHLTACNGFRCAATNNESAISVLAFDGETYSVQPFAAELPAVNVTWHGATAYCEALGRRLPTEAEWEFAARGPEGRLYPWGDTFDTAFARTRVDEQTVSVPVDAYIIGASPYGALNMAGNIAEWTADWYAPDAYSGRDGTENPTGPAGGTERVVRGGSWDAVPFFARSVHRQFLTPNFNAAWVGFRCAADEDGPVDPDDTRPTPTAAAPILATPTATATP